MNYIGTEDDLKIMAFRMGEEQLNRDNHKIINNFAIFRVIFFVVLIMFAYVVGSILRYLGLI